KALTMRPDMANIHYAIGLIYVEKGNYEGAEAALKKALEVDQDLVDAHKVLADVYRSKGMLGEADREDELYKSRSSPHH
ncbi:MAG: tetratricopeptide repeat protein, partial [Planctomycetota bacterium]